MHTVHGAHITVHACDPLVTADSGSSISIRSSIATPENLLEGLLEGPGSPASEKSGTPLFPKRKGTQAVNSSAKSKVC